MAKKETEDTREYKFLPVEMEYALKRMSLFEVRAVKKFFKILEENKKKVIGLMDEEIKERSILR